MPIRATSPLSSRAPARATRRFVGRAKELERLAELCADRATRLVSVVGPPGVGKTRLAMELLHSHPNPVPPLWIDAGNLATVEELAASIAGRLGVAPAGAGPALHRVARVLAGQGPLLLVIDDADMLGAALGEAATAWLHLAPELRVVVTSRARLGKNDETVLEVGPLAERDAVTLLDVRMRGARRESRDSGTPEIRRELVRRLDGMPLAIELAAARTSVLPPRKLLERLDQHVGELLRARPARADPRHASLSAAIEVSWQLLEDDERTTLCQCAAFRGSFALEAAEAVVEGPPDVVESLAVLVERSLLQREEMPTLDGEVRFALYASVRAFALERLEQRGERERVEARVDDAVVAACEPLVRALEGPGARQAEEKLELEREQLAATQRRTLDRSPAVSARAGLVLAELCALRGVNSTTLHEETVGAARATGDAALIARSLAAFAVAAGRLGYGLEPLRALDEAVRVADEAAEREVLARSLLARGRYHAQHGAFDEADTDLARGLAVERELDKPWLAGALRNVVGCVAEIRGSFTPAVVAFEAAKSSFRRAGSERMEAAVVNNLGVTRQAEGRLEDSRELFEQALELAVASHNQVIQADAHMNLGSWYLGQGDLDCADRHSRLGLAMQRRLGNRRFEGLACMNLAMSAHERGELREARTRYQRALDILRECGEARFVAMGLPFFAAAQASLGLVTEARSDFDAARQPPPGMDPSFDVVVSTLEAFLLLAEARFGDDAMRAEAEREAGHRFARAQSFEAGTMRRPELLQAIRLLGRVFGPAGAPSGALTAVDDSDRASSANVSGQTLQVGGTQRWFRLGDAKEVDLSKRASLRLILRALVEQRQDAPSVGLGIESLFEAGWPQQKVLPQAAATRVYTAINTLRRLGLDDVLLRQDDGYLIDPAVSIARVEPDAPAHKPVVSHPKTAR